MLRYIYKTIFSCQRFSFSLASIYGLVRRSFWQAQQDNCKRQLPFVLPPEAQERIAQLSRFLAPVKAVGYEKIRRGGPNDGGYVCLNDLQGFILPVDLGFYDLRLPERAAGSSGRARKRVRDLWVLLLSLLVSWPPALERPFNEVLASGKPVFPFCLCWANENWTRKWDGREQQILVPQSYSPEDDRNHIR